MRHEEGTPPDADGLIEDGKVTPVIDRRYPFAEISAAVEYSMAGHVAGKVVVSI